MHIDKQSTTITPSVTELVEQFLAWQPQWDQHPGERRAYSRQPFEGPVSIEPVTDGWGGLHPHERLPVKVNVKDISPLGVAFYHTHAIPTRRVVVRLAKAGGEHLALLTVIRWCHAVDEDCYLSGGTFVGTVHEDSEAPSGSHSSK